MKQHGYHFLMTTNETFELDMWNCVWRICMNRYVDSYKQANVWNTPGLFSRTCCPFFLFSLKYSHTCFTVKLNNSFHLWQECSFSYKSQETQSMGQNYIKRDQYLFQQAIFHSCFSFFTSSLSSFCFLKVNLH